MTEAQLDQKRNTAVAWGYRQRASTPPARHRVRYSGQHRALAEHLRLRLSPANHGIKISGKRC